MKDLYVVTVELDEDSEYFTEMTKRQAVKMREVLGKTGHPFRVERVKDSSGFHGPDGLIVMFQEWGRGDE